MVPKREVNGRFIGQEEVLIEEAVITVSGRRYRRLDEAAVAHLKQAKLINERVAALYLQQAAQADFPGR